MYQNHRWDGKLMCCYRQYRRGSGEGNENVEPMHQIGEPYPVFRLKCPFADWLKHLTDWTLYCPHVLSFQD